MQIIRYIIINRGSSAFNFQQILLPLLASLILAQLCHAQNDIEKEKHMRRDLSGIGELLKNVTCIAHEAKFSCDCQNVNQQMILPHLIGFVYQVEISNCKSLTIDSNTFEETQGLRKIAFKNVDNLVLKTYALSFSRFAPTPLIVEFEKVNFEIIDSHAINGNIEEISFIGGRIDAIHPFGFTTFKERAIILKLDNVLIKRIEPQAFKKFSVEQLEITNCIFDSNVPSKAFYELEVTNTLRIDNVRFNDVHTRAFSFKLISRLSIGNNYFNSVDSEWIEAKVRDNIIIQQNVFGTTNQIAFKGITVHRDYVSSEHLELRFTNNTVRFPFEPRPLEFSDRFTLNIKQLRYDNNFICKDVDTTQQPPQPYNVFFQTFKENIYFRRIDIKSTSHMTDNNNFIVLSKIIEWDCQQPSYMLYILLGVSALILILLVFAGILWVRLSKRRKRRKMDVVLPEARTYKETQIVYQIENAGLLKTDL